MAKISWRDVPMTNSEGREANAEERAAGMREYRAKACINDWFLATPEELEAADDDEAPDLGPKREEVDFSGLDFTVRVGSTKLSGEYETLAEVAEAAVQSGFGDHGKARVVVRGPTDFDGTLDELLAEVGLEA